MSNKKYNLSYLLVSNNEEKIKLYDPITNKKADIDTITALIVELCNGENTLDKIINILSLAEIKDSEAKVLNTIDKLDKLGYIHLESDIIGNKDSSRLKLIYLNITSKCNMKCAYCCVDANGGEFIDNTCDMPLNSIRKIIDKIYDYDNEIEINLMGGEPFVRNDIIDIINYIISKGLKVSITTNGTAISTKIIKQLPKEIDMMVSLDSVVSESNDILRSNTDKVLCTIRELIDNGIYPILGITLSTITLPHLTSTLDFCKDHKLSPSISLLDTFGRGSKCSDFCLSEHEILNTFEILKNYYNNYNISRQVFNFCKQVNYNECFVNKYCGMGRTVVSIASNGDLYPCVNLHLPEFFVGNILNNDFSLLVDKARSQYTYSVDDMPNCNSCDVKYICGGGCRSDGYWTSGSVLGAKNKCNAMKKMIYMDIMNL